MLIFNKYNIDFKVFKVNDLYFLYQIIRKWRNNYCIGILQFKINLELCKIVSTSITAYKNEKLDIFAAIFCSFMQLPAKWSSNKRRYGISSGFA